MLIHEGTVTFKQNQHKRLDTVPLIVKEFLELLSSNIVLQAPAYKQLT